MNLLIEHLQERAKLYGKSSLQALFAHRVLPRLEVLEEDNDHEVLNRLVEGTCIEEYSTDHHVGLHAECAAAEAVYDFICARSSN